MINWIVIYIEGALFSVILFNKLLVTTQQFLLDQDKLDVINKTHKKKLIYINKWV